MAQRKHGEHKPGCPACNAEGGAKETELCTCLEDGYAEGLRRWEKACSCCFGDAHPEGLEAAIANAVKA